MHTFQQDNARAHTVRVTTQYLANNDVHLHDWPALSLDLSPVEHLWYYLGQRISRRTQMNNHRELENALQQEWNAIHQNTIRRLIGSTRRRCMACIAGHGGHCDPTLFSYVDELKLINDCASFLFVVIISHPSIAVHNKNIYC